MGSCRTDGASLCQIQGLDISISPLHQRMEYTELRLTDGVATFPWPRFSDTRIQVRNIETLDLTHEAPAVRHEPIYLLFFSVTPCLRGAKVLSLILVFALLTPFPHFASMITDEVRPPWPQ